MRDAKTDYTSSSSSLSGELLSQVTWNLWEYQRASTWQLLPLEDCCLVDACIAGKLGVVILSLSDGAKYLLDTEHLSLVSIHSSSILSLWFICSDTFSIRISPDSIALRQAASSSQMLHKALSLFPSDRASALRFLASSVSPFSPLLSSTSSSYSSVEIQSLKLLPPLSFHPEITADTKNDDFLFQPVRQFFNSETAVWSLDDSFRKSAWAGPFKRLFCLTEIPRSPPHSCFSVEENRGFSKDETIQLITHGFTKIEIVYSRILLLQILLKSGGEIPSFLPAASLWIVLKIVWLQSESSSLWSSFCNWFHWYIRREHASPPLQSSYHTLSTLLSVMREDLDTSFDFLLRGAYHENEKTISSPTFNLDSAISSEPQLRVVSGVVDLVASSPSWDSTWLHWLVSRICSLEKSQYLMVRTYCFLWLHRLQRTRREEWIHQEIADTVSSSQVLAAIQHELQWFPLFSLPTKALLDLVHSPPLDSSLQSTFLHIPPHQSTFLHIPPHQSTFLHLPPHQRIHLGNRPIQPPWTLECWVKIPDGIESPTALSILSSPIASVDILCGMRRNRIQLLVDGETVTLDCNIPANQWSHIAIVMDAQVTVRCF